MAYEVISETRGPYREMEVEQCLSRELGFGLGVRWVLSKAAWGSSGHTQEQNSENMRKFKPKQ